jgi:hypothetical protein
VEIRQSYAIVGALSIHRIPEGLAIGAGFASGHGSRLGWLLVAAVGIQNICEGVVMGAPLRLSGVSPSRGLLVVAASGLAVPLGALLGHGLSSWAFITLPLHSGPGRGNPHLRDVKRNHPGIAQPRPRGRRVDWAGSGVPADHVDWGSLALIGGHPWTILAP